jgi:hypothetical protein
MFQMTTTNKTHSARLHPTHKLIVELTKTDDRAIRSLLLDTRTSGCVLIVGGAGELTINKFRSLQSEIAAVTVIEAIEKFLSTLLLPNIAIYHGDKRAVPFESDRSPCAHVRTGSSL